ncbi:MAG: hypothetical protein OEU32_04550, partial [Acidimicrobiia bacterium]|nr:hypothetical protein [Acidimicrobiia bacterium]
MPRFDEPVLTRPGAQVCAELGVELSCLPALPTMIEPDPTPPVEHDDDEPLVEVSHPRISVLEHYRQAGWTHAGEGTWLRRSTLDRLGVAASNLPDRWGICVFDAWRPLALQAELYHAAYGHPRLPPGFVSYPDPNPNHPPPHLTGGTVDCSLTLDGIPLALGSGFDDFSDRSRADALENDPGIDRELRRRLFWTIHDAG